MGRNKRQRFHDEPYEMDLVNIAVQLAHGGRQSQPMAQRPQQQPHRPRPPNLKPRPPGSNTIKPVYVEVSDRAAASTWRMPEAAWCATRSPETRVIFFVVSARNGMRDHIGITTIADIRARGIRRAMHP